MEKEEIKLVELYARLTNTLDRFVYLREDEKGRYIEYAFIDGAPHDNRCLSWYDKLQPKALKRNNHDIEKWSKRLKKVGELYKLNRFNCGRDNNEGEERCDAGSPLPRCLKFFASNWTYDEPVKCACWFLEYIGVDDIKNGEVIEMYKRTMKIATQKAEQFLSSNLISTFTDKGTLTATKEPMSQTEFIENFKDFMLCLGEKKIK